MNQKNSLADRLKAFVLAPAFGWKRASQPNPKEFILTPV